MILLAFVPFKVYNKSNFRGRLIHRNINKWDFLPPKIGVDLYTSSTYTPENTVVGAPLTLPKQALPAFHTITGADNTGSFSGIKGERCFLEGVP